MKFPRSLLLLVTGLLCLGLTGCIHLHRHKSDRPKGPGVSGSIVYVPNIQLPPEAVIELQLVELSRDGSAVRIVASDTLPRPAVIPAPFFLGYSRRDISGRHAYAVTARILAGGKVLFASERPTPVITKGNPKAVEVLVAPVK